MIRTESDEVTYALHVMVRYELEKRVMSGTLEVKDLANEWKKLYKEYLGVDVPNDREGVLEAIKANRVAAVETFGDGEYNVLGDYRYVSFARFLIEWYFPYFPIITAEEGKLMHEYILGNKEAKEKLEKRADNTTNFYKTFYNIK